MNVRRLVGSCELNAVDAYAPKLDPSDAKYISVTALIASGRMPVRSSGVGALVGMLMLVTLPFGLLRLLKYDAMGSPPLTRANGRMGVTAFKANPE
jgi:hypothetical protein